MRGLSFKNKIIKRCEFCGNMFELFKDGFNLHTDEEPFKGEHEESFICNECYLKMLKNFEIYMLWKFQYELMNHFNFPFLEGVMNFARCENCGKLYPRPDKRYKFCGDECYKEHRREYKRLHERARYHKL